MTAVRRTSNDGWYDIVRDGGAVVGGDATTALTGALAASLHISAPAGTFTIQDNAGITLSQIGQVIRGAGRFTTRFINSGQKATGDILTLAADYTRLEGIAVGPLQVSTTTTGSNLLSNGTINVADTTDFPASGTAGFNAQDGSVFVGARVSYTGKTSTTFTGCTLLSGSGTAGAGTTVQLLPTTGSGIKLSSGAFSTLKDIAVLNCYDQIVSVDASTWSLDNFYLNAAARYGVYIQDTAVPDLGGQHVGFGTNQSGHGDAGWRFESGGGMQASMLKCTGYKYALDVQAASTVTTSVLAVGAVSFENQYVYNIRIGGGAGTWDLVSIGNVEMRTPIVASGGIRFEANASVCSIGNLVARAASGNSAICFDVAGGDSRMIGNAAIHQYAKGEVVTAPAARTTFGLIHYKAVPIPFIDNISPTQQSQGVWDHRYHLYINAVTDNSNFTNAWTLGLAANRGCVIDWTIEGTAAGTGSFVRHIRALIERDAGDCTVTEISNTTGAHLVDYQFDTATTSGSVIFGVRRNAGTSISGWMELQIKGYPLQLSVPQTAGATHIYP